MRVIQVEYTKTRQVERFEPEKLGLTIQLEAGESVLEAIAQARRTCAIAFGDAPNEWDIAEKVELLRNRLQDEEARLDEVHAYFS